MPLFVLCLSLLKLSPYSEIGLMLHMLLVGPLFAIEEEETHVLPIDGVGLSRVSVSDGWHLEWEQGRSLHHLLFILVLVEAYRLASALIQLDDIIVRKELTVESSNDHDLVRG